MPCLNFNLPDPLLLLIAILAWLVYKFSCIRNDRHRLLRGIPGPTPLPIIGTMYKTLRHGTVETDLAMIKEYGKVVALYYGSLPTIQVSDPEMLNEILVKNAHCFRNRRDMGIADEPLHRMLITAKDDDWKDVRNSISPAFTSSKLRNMVEDIKGCCQTFTNNIERMQGEAFDVKKHTSHLSTDLIARTAFGIDVDSQSDIDNVFVMHMKSTLDLSFKNPFIFASVIARPLLPLVKRLGFRFLHKDTIAYFEGLVKRAIDCKAQDSPPRSDLLLAMVNIVRSGDKTLTQDDILANSINIFFAAYSTLSDAMIFTLYLLARHSEVQDKLFAEMDTSLPDDFTYDDINKLQYLSMVLDESLRMYSPFITVNRICNQDVVIHGILFPKGVQITVPIAAMHRDPDVWPNPDKFDPERFSPEKKRDLKNWMPFGIGPKQCIGMRLGPLQVKVATVLLLKKFKVTPCRMTPMTLKRKKLSGSPIDLYLKVTQR